MTITTTTTKIDVKKQIRNSKRIVIKLGSSLIFDEKNAKIRDEELKSICEDLSDLHKLGHEIIIVSSGAIALGCNELKMTKKQALKVTQKQSLAAIGQICLIKAYQEIFKNLGINVAQVLLTLEDSEHRKRYLNAKNTINSLVKIGVIPVINENDTVATSEIKFGDNDRLSARVAGMAHADLLILLSDIDGLYTADPRSNKDAKFIDVIHEIDEKITSFAGNSSSNVGTGGMITKLLAGKICMDSGTKMLIAMGKGMNPIKRILEGDRCSLFISDKTPVNAFKTWLMGSLKPLGEIFVDDMAEKALHSGKSLLSAGVKKVTGSFVQGDLVQVKNLRGDEIGKGLTYYSHTEAKRIMGKSSKEIEIVLGYKGEDELIHRDNLVIN